jgi:hypothetical protein
LIQALNAMGIQQQQPQGQGTEWYLDTGASSHMSSSSGNLTASYPSTSSRIIVGDGSTLAVSHTGRHTIPTSQTPLQLRNVLVSPKLIKNLISVKALCRDNPVTIEFDALGFSVKDRRTRRVILRCDSGGDLYPVTTPTVHRSLTAVTTDLWHERLGHPGRDALTRALRQADPATTGAPSSTCQACRLGKSVRLSFSDSEHVSFFPFQLVHCDIWTSPVLSLSGCKYYLVLLDDYSHFAWTFPLRQKSDVLATIRTFHVFVQHHFNLPILTLQTDNGREFDSHDTRAFSAD